MNYKKVLIVAAHPDDEILGCGGTIRKLTDQGAIVETLILGEGPTARSDLSAAEKTALKTAAENADKSVGVSAVFFADLPDNRFDTLPLLTITQTIEARIAAFKPEAIFAHFEGDLNRDHVLTARAVLTAARPLPGSSVKAIFAFEVPSSTEWNFSETFAPNTFVGIDLNAKLTALKHYQNELRDFPHPRSIEAVTHLAGWRGAQSGVGAAEAFRLIRSVAP